MRRDWDWDWKYVAAIAALTIVAMVRVASTHRVFSEVLDEPAHLAAGFEWLKGRYVIDASHPPLARILGAIPLWLADYPLPETREMVKAGNELLYHGDRYLKTLARARMGNLLLFAVAIAATVEWARRAFSTTVAVVSAALLTTLPPVLGHAGFITTDLAALAAIPVALLALDRYLESRTRGRAAVLGVALGFGLLTKFSFLVYFPPCALLLALGRRRRPEVKGIALALGVAALLVWAGYRFDFRTPNAYHPHHAAHVFHVAAPKPLQQFADWAAVNLPIPAPALAVGLGMLQAHNQEGHNAYLFGEMRMNGWWYYFPVVFFYKTPLPYQLLAAWGALLIVLSRDRLRLAYLLCAAAVMGVAMTSDINIGIRHILPLYAPLSIVAAYGVVEIWKRARDAFGRTILAALLAWLFAGVALDHPDYLAWFNEAAQPNPAHIAVDSNLDWGQDTLRLEKAVRELKIDHIYVDVMTNMRLDKFGIPVEGFAPAVKPTGWVAVSETPYTFHTATGSYGWLSTYRPVRRIGDSIRLYYFP
ncbi:MAG TPA: glycosyltransferase family 39 protein [Thermoanaerobaculia bacterium]